MTFDDLTEVAEARLLAKLGTEAKKVIVARRNNGSMQPNVNAAWQQRTSTKTEERRARRPIILIGWRPLLVVV